MLIFSVSDGTRYNRAPAGEIVSNQLMDKELLEQFKAVKKLNNEDKHLIKTFIDAFLTKRHLQKLAL